MAELKRQIPINTTPEKVFAALAPQAGLRSWWTADAPADEKPSGKAECSAESGISGSPVARRPG
jgi:uncharacterized protein YndB with AHSA1/START domain